MGFFETIAALDGTPVTVFTTAGGAHVGVLQIDHENEGICMPFKAKALSAEALERQRAAQADFDAKHGPGRAVPSPWLQGPPEDIVEVSRVVIFNPWHIVSVVTDA